jgi:hypothetical protein
MIVRRSKINSSSYGVETGFLEKINRKIAQKDSKRTK